MPIGESPKKTDPVGLARFAREYALWWVGIVLAALEVYSRWDAVIQMSAWTHRIVDYWSFWVHVILNRISDAVGWLLIPPLEHIASYFVFIFVLSAVARFTVTDTHYITRKIGVMPAKVLSAVVSLAGILLFIGPVITLMDTGWIAQVFLIWFLVTFLASPDQITLRLGAIVTVVLTIAALNEMSKLGSSAVAAPNATYAYRSDFDPATYLARFGDAIVGGSKETQKEHVDTLITNLVACSAYRLASEQRKQPSNGAPSSIEYWRRAVKFAAAVDDPLGEGPSAASSRVMEEEITKDGWPAVHNTYEKHCRLVYYNPSGFLMSMVRASAKN